MMGMCLVGELYAVIKYHFVHGIYLGPDEWNEIKICPPFTVLALPPTKLAICPADFCNDKVKSYESHARKHLSLILAEQRKTTRLNGNCDFPSSLKFGYYCNDGDCYAGLLMLDQSRGFNRMKYLKQVRH